MRRPNTSESEDALSLTSRGPLSWQQTLNLRRNRRLGVRTVNVGAVFPMPPGESIPGLHKRLADITAREDVLRITGFDVDDTEQGTTYADKIDLPFSTVSGDSADEALALVADRLNHEFAYDAGPLWNLTVISHPDRVGRPTRTVCVAMDHHIADHHSMALLRDEIAGVDDEMLSPFRGAYREWVTWQRGQFPMGRAAAVPSPAHDFWLRYFDGGAPNHATILPFCRPNAPVGGVEHITSRDLPATGDALRAAGAQLGATAFLIIVASIASAVGLCAAETDTTLRYVTHGRTHQNVGTLGWFCDNMPLRVRSTSLADPHHALDAAVASRLELMEFETTPWGYIMEVCSQTDTERPQVVLNVFEIDDQALPALPRKPRPEVQGDGATPAASNGGRGDLPPDLNLMVLLPRESLCRLECRFDPSRFTPDGVEGFMDVVCDHLRRLVEA
jgi:hypothetical protein